MHWKVKSLIQNGIVLLPKPLANNLYFQMQRHFGGLKNLDPIHFLKSGKEFFKLIREQGKNPVGKVFFEVGTGRSPMLPLSYWLMGAKQTITVDLNHYVREEVLFESLQILCRNKAEVEEALKRELQKERFYQLIEMMDHPFDMQKFFELTQIDYLAPADARNVNLPDKSIDFHTSFTVLEHIPKEVMIAIMKEGKRLLKDDGLFVHLVDYSDHFSHSDNQINSINFLQYSDLVWDLYAGNRYMYMNRLRHDDFIHIFEQFSKLLKVEPYSDQKVLKQIETGDFKVHSKFQNKDPKTLAITHSMIVAEK